MPSTLVPPDADRAEKLRRLRAAIREKRAGDGGGLASRMRRDPVTTMLAIGVDDATVLRDAPRIVNNPRAYAGLVSERVRETLEGGNGDVGDSDDEEAPPSSRPLE
jgi:hypothetical protein